MNRRDFLVFAGIGAVAAVVAPRLLLDCSVPPPGWGCTRGAGHGGPCAATETVEWTPRTAYRRGDVVRVSGFANGGYNGLWVMGDNGALARRG